METSIEEPRKDNDDSAFKKPRKSCRGQPTIDSILKCSENVFERNEPSQLNTSVPLNPVSISQLGPIKKRKETKDYISTLSKEKLTEALFAYDISTARAMRDTLTNGLPLHDELTELRKANKFI